MILGDVEEVITVVEYDEDTYEEHVKVRVFCTKHTSEFILWSMISVLVEPTLFAPHF